MLNINNNYLFYDLPLTFTFKKKNKRCSPDVCLGNVYGDRAISNRITPTASLKICLFLSKLSIVERGYIGNVRWC